MIQPLSIHKVVSDSLKAQWASGKRHGHAISPELRARMREGIAKRKAAGLYSIAQKQGWQTRIENGTAVSGATGKHWKHTQEQRLRMSAAQRKRFEGKTSLKTLHKAERRGVEWKLWREAIFKRDDYTCQFCGIRGGVELHPHHIKPFSKFPETKYDVNNGVTLCRDCHLVTPSFGVRVRTFNYIAA